MVEEAMGSPLLPVLHPCQDSGTKMGREKEVL